MSMEDRDVVPAKRVRRTVKKEPESEKTKISTGPKEPENAEIGNIWISDGEMKIATSTGTWTTVGPAGVTGPVGVTGPTGIVSGTISTTTSPTWGTGGMVTRRPGPAPSKQLPAPTKRPQKILVAFLGKDDEVEWCAKVHPDDIDVSMDKDDPATRVELGFWLIEAD